MTSRTLIATAFVAALTAGCGESGDDAPNKAGAPVEGERQDITLQATDPGSAEAQYLAERIERRSGGSVRVRLEVDYDSRRPSNEVKLARALRAGREDLAILPARAWQTAGLPGFAALQAPFVIGTNEVARRALEGPAGEALSAELRDAGVEPLALVPTQLRRLLADRPLLGPESFRGVRLRIIDNDTTARSIEALGGVPKQGLGSNEVLGEIQGGRLDGVESAPAFIADNDYQHAVRRLTGYGLFSRVDTIVATPRALTRLSPDQQEAVRGAAADTTRYAASLADRESADVAGLCRQGVRVDVPALESLDALAAATEPVLAALARDPATAKVLGHLRDTPGAGPEPLPAPEECTSAGRAAPKIDSKPRIPDGTYITTLTPADYERFGEYSEVTERERTHAHTFRDGKISYRVRPEWGPLSDQCIPACEGTYETAGDRLLIDWDRPGWADEEVGWSYLGGRLTFTDAEASDPIDKALYLAHPWRRVR